MTIYTSNMMSSMINAGNAGMFGNAAYAQQMSMGMGMMPPGAMGMGMPAPMGFMSAMSRGMGGMYGERMAAGLGSMGVGAMGFGRLGVELGAGMLGGSMGTALGSAMGMGAIGAGAMGMAGSFGMTMPIMAAGGAVRAYGGAFMGGMEDQAALNGTLRNNFNFFGGSGPMGRGFNQSQMGQVGSMISGELRRNPFSNASEMNQLIAGGADSGMLTGVRDVQQFTQGFRRMLDTLRSVQRELGGTLTEALQFVRSSQQAGIFQNADRVNFASEIRNAEAVTGMDRTQLTALAATGASISRNFGGAGRSGAYGALRGAQTLGAAMSSGAINAEMMSEATGGLTGAEAISAFTTRMMEHTGRFSRTGMGRFSLFALSNREGTGMDAEMLERFRSGDISVGDVSRRAHSNVRGMGRARALNNEGHLRGELMEEGGMAAQIGMMRLMLGDRVMDRGDDFAQLVMQRRFNMSRPESELMTSLIRNQSTIADREMFDRMGARREADTNRDVRENRSVDALMTHLEHGLSDATGLTRTREMGRNLLTRLSSAVERAANAIMGTTVSSLTEGDRAAINRISVGRGTAADFELLNVGGAGAGEGTVTSESLFRRSMAGDALGRLGLHGMESIGERLERRGVTGLRGPDADITANRAIEDARRAASGIVSGEASDRLRGLEANTDATTRRIAMARFLAGRDDPSAAYSYLGGGEAGANSVDAFLARRGMASIDGGVSRGALGGLGGATGGDVLSRIAAGAMAGGSAGLGGGLISGLLGGLIGAGGGLASLGADSRDNPISFISRGGHLAESLRRGGGNERLVERLGGVNEDALRAVTDTDSFRRRLGRIGSALESGGDWKGEIQNIITESEGTEDPAHREALMAAAMELEHNIGTTGAMGSEFESLRMTPERRAEIITSLREAGGNASGMARALSGGQGGNAELAAMFERAGTEFGALNAEGGSAAMAEARVAMSRMDPDSAEYRRLAESIGSVEGGDAMLSGASSMRRSVRDLTGRGRRGRVGADEALVGALTGGRFGEMDIELTRGERTHSVRSAHELMGLIRRGGADAESVLTQLTEGLGGMGVRNAGELTRFVTGAMEGGITDDEARDITTRFESEMASTEEGSLGAAARAATEATARRNNPLDATRNDLLTEIRNSVRTMASAAGGDDQMTRADGAAA